ncbi:hypothetical protein SAZ10_03965 [Mesorhizobium sp. BAC0120]|nr:hypothetical protein [Mesorhizobium sp. BAC0120]MDW6020913.1 hypothetical protein [Mesorhizobium sp. BAC0120]
MQIETIKPTQAELKARRNRSIAIGLALFAFVIVVYVASIVRMST